MEKSGAVWRCVGQCGPELTDKPLYSTTAHVLGFFVLRITCINFTMKVFFFFYFSFYELYLDALASKLDGVDPADNRPSTDYLTHFVKKNKK